MKKLIYILLLLPILASAQSTFTAPVGYNTGAPSAAPSAIGTRIRFDLETNRIYTWSPDALNWQLQGYTIEQISGTVAPAYAPVRGQSWFVINSDTLPRLFQYLGTGTNWKCLNCSDGKTYTDGTGIAISASNVISNTGDLSATNELNTGFDINSGNLRVIDAGATRTVALTSIAPVQSVAGGTGITVSGTNSLTVTNNAPDQTVILSGAGTVSTSGTYPNFTVTGNGIGGSGTTGYFPYFSAPSTLSNSGLYWDGSRLGIGTASPTARLDNKGSGSTSATYNALFKNSNNDEILLIKDNGEVYIKNISLATVPPSYPFRVQFNDLSNAIEVEQGSVKNINIGSASSNIIFNSAIIGTISGTSRALGLSTFNFRVQGNGQTSFREDGTNAFVAASAIVECVSTSKGFLPPRMTATQASAISSPAEGLMIYVTNTNGTFTAKGWWGYNGAAWEKLNN